MKELELHPLCSLFPRIAGAEFNALVADIKANGLREPIIIHDGMILDGGNRYRACIEAGVEPAVMKFGGGNLVSYVLSANLHRRHLSPGQQAAIVASAQDWAKAQTIGKPKSGNVTGLDTVAMRQAQSGASDKTQRDADKVAKASPELAKQVAHGEISLPKAIEKITGKVKPKEATDQDETYTETDHLIDQLRGSVSTLSEENDRLANIAAAKVFEGSDDDRAELLGRLDSLVAENRQLRIELDAVKSSRDGYQRENAQLKNQLRMQRKQLGMAA